MYKFSKLFQEYYPKFVRFANSYLEDEAAAEDIVMDSFMYYWENKSTIDPATNPPAYLLTTIKNKCLNALRAKKVRQEAGNKIHDHNQRLLEASIITLEACNPTDIFCEEITTLASQAINSLPQQTKKVFIKNRFENKSYKEIADEMGISVKSVEKHITKALKILRVALKAYLSLIPYLYI